MFSALQRSGFLLGVVLALGAGFALAQQQPEPPGPQDRPPFPAPGPEGSRPGYFLGVQCEPAPDYVKKHVLNTDHGLVVRMVIPDSPAAKAGIEQGAVLLQADETPLTTPEVLRRIIQASKGKPVKLLVWQRGKKKTLTVTPKQMDLFSQRPQELPWEGVFPAPPWPGMEMFFGPVGKIPDDVSIRIEKPAGKPAQVRVQRGKEVWVAPLKQLNKLPREPRRWVRALLAGVSMPWPMPPAMDVPEMPLPPRGPEEDFQRQLERLRQQLQQMQRRLERLEHHRLPPEGK